MKQVLLIGPLPPPWGGARVSFQLFYDFLLNNSEYPITHLDVPVRRNRDGSPPGSVNHKKTLQIVVSSLRIIPQVEFVTVFGSRSFCFSYGLIILMVSKLFGKACHFRFFGGRPMLEFANRPKILAKALLYIIGLANVFSLETEFGASEFPKRIREKTIVIPGYRSRVGVETFAKNDNVTRFVYVGGMVDVKGVSILADAFSNLSVPDVELHLYGTGDPEIVDRLQKIAGAVYHGKVENEILRGHLPRYDVFVFPTMYTNEGHPGVLIEAFMAGLPIIATDMPGINEMVQDKENGLIVPPGDSAALTDAMRLLAIDDDDVKESLSRGAIKSSDRYDEHVVLPQLKRAMGWQ